MAETRVAKVREQEDEILLGILAAVQQDSQVTQRNVAQQLGIALGLANAYLKRCVRKGYVKVQQIPRRRYAYYLTPTGFSEKSRLTAKYLSGSFDFFRRARNDCTALLNELERNGCRRVALAGLSDMVDIVSLCARGSGVSIAGIIDPAASEASYVGIPLVHDAAALSEIDAVIVTGLNPPQEFVDELVRTLGIQRVVVPRVLKVVPRSEAEAG